jgi:hypothetical protein
MPRASSEISRTLSRIVPLVENDLDRLAADRPRSHLGLFDAGKRTPGGTVPSLRRGRRNVDFRGIQVNGGEQEEQGDNNGRAGIRDIHGKFDEMA